MLFSGAYNHSMDNKGRTVIPSKFRTKLGERFYVTVGMNGCLWIMADEAWREFQGTLKPKSLLDSSALRLERFFVGSAVECAPDGQGRVFIPQNLRDHAKIMDNIWVVGVNDRVEIWSDAQWKAANEEMTDEKIQHLYTILGNQEQATQS